MIFEDAGIVDEVANLDDISKTIKSQDLIDTAQKARGKNHV